MKMDASTNQKTIKEGKAEICLKSEKVFYNPVQEFNRDLSIAVLTIFTNDFKAEKLAKAEKKAKNRIENVKEDVEGGGPETEVCYLVISIKIKLYIFHLGSPSLLDAHCSDLCGCGKNVK